MMCLIHDFVTGIFVSSIIYTVAAVIAYLVAKENV